MNNRGLQLYAIQADSKHIAASESEHKNVTYEKYTAPNICLVLKKYVGEVSRKMWKQNVNMFNISLWFQPSVTS